jgi:hypothetical protein
MSNRMTRAASWFLGLALLLFPLVADGQTTNQSPNQTPAQSDANPFLRVLGNGTWWSTLSSDKKWDFIDGYTTAMGSVRRMLLGQYKAGAKELDANDPQFKARMDALLNFAVLADYYDYDVDRIKLLAGIDEFYKDPQNTRIPIELALQYVRDTVNGKNAPRDLEKQLNEWRASVNK